jgi:hypothetical protein
MSSNAQKVWLSGLLTLAIAVVYAQVLGHEFINLDDDQYVTANAQVRDGLTARGIAWAFFEFGSFNWHPLTWISHMLDVQLFGLDAGAHHATSVLFHIANSLLLFHVLAVATRQLGPAAMVAGLFALHPAHVESVAWVSERKDVLSTLFMFLTLSAYLRYCDRGTPRSRLLVGVYFALGLMSKPMLVSLPFVLLLLDLWPLNRFAPNRDSVKRELPSLVKEKLPLFALAALSIIATIRAQASGGAMKAGAGLSLMDRLDNGLVSYVRYLAEAFFPSDLAIYYPHPGGWPGLWVLSSLALLVAISALALWRLNRQPYLAVGWFWFVGTLVPVIGLVQVGSQSMADRYTYVPYVGLFVAIVWGVRDWAAQLEGRMEGRLNGRPLRVFVNAAAVLVILCCGIASWQYTAAWKNTITIFTHSLMSTDPDYPALIGRSPARENPSARPHNGLYTPYYNLGTALAEARLLNKARLHFDAAILASPGFPDAYTNMGVVLAQQGDLDGSKRYYERALAIDPGNALATRNLALLRRAMGD